MSPELQKPKSVDDGFVMHQYQLHAESVFRKCLRIGGNVQWAEDVTQDVFVRLMENHDRLEDRQSIGGWLHTVAYRCCLDRLKRERSIWTRVRNAFGQMRLNEHPPAPDDVVQARHDLLQVFTVLQQLPPKARMVFTMKHLDNRSQQEIAKILGVSNGFVSKLLKRATNLVRRAGWEVGDD